ncbi:hypothetical protein WG901_19445 [Novosphingobium sp. PS1R-30]|uniref:Uncharacterized protein n=1 Tax=Novosphingobium anseongense TaxID=3133436 RepID=A0ABU8S0Q4_9SPHN
MSFVHSGGLDVGFDRFLAECPADPEMRDSATIWFMDDSGDLALPRVTIDAVAGDWSRPCLQLNYVDARGRTLRIWTQGRGLTGEFEAGRASLRGAGPLKFRCREPYARWSVSFAGTALGSTTTRQLEGLPDGAPVDLAFELEATMAAPPWLMGGLTPEAANQMADEGAAVLMGGLRYEQLCRVVGTIAVAGEARAVRGTGMRVRRQGVRRMGGAQGHCQHSALFSSGRGFGAIIMAPGPEGPVVFNEAFVLRDGKRLPARVIEAPWMTRLVEKGDDASLLLATEDGPVRIEGEVLASVFDREHFEMADSSILHQGTARYRWDGEETIGLLERCTLRSRLDV